ncbi:malate dehydrogenase [Pseudonocardia sp. CNS-139]|nr:malate dehydrogenase [Pseudonocardia sp. CNS-139]
MFIAAGELEAAARSILTAAGCSPEEAARVARQLLDANLAGHDSHGIGLVPTYVRWLQDGLVHAGRHIDVVTDGGTFAVLEGNRGLGQTIAAEATAFGVERARRHGTCVVALRGTGHVGRVGAYAETAIEAGLVSIHLVNVSNSPIVAPFGAVERRFSTAPFAIGLPLPGRPLVLDFATSLVAAGKVQVASYGGKPLPPDSLIGADGRISGDPHLLYGDYAPTDVRSAANGTGAIRAFGEHKGSGLALMCELLGGALTGGAPAGPSPQEPGGITNGMLSVYLSPAHLGTQAEFERTARDYLDWVLSARPVDPDAPVLAPGDAEARTRAVRLAEGVPVPADTWATLRLTAERVGAPFGG